MKYIPIIIMICCALLFLGVQVVGFIKDIIKKRNKKLNKGNSESVDISENIQRKESDE